MKLRIASDLHTEFWNRSPVLIHDVLPHLDTDKDSVLCLAGDIGLAHRPETWLHLLKDFALRFKAVVYVEGNHFFYHNNYFDRINLLKDAVKLPKNVHFLEDESVVIDGILFLGATLWTDLHPADDFMLEQARRSMMDYRCCKWETGHYLTPIDTVVKHEHSKKFIFNTLESNGVAMQYAPNDACDKTVVVTHHMPSYQCVSERFKGDILNPAFCSNLDADIERIGPDLWIFGHTHDSHDSMLGETRLLCNPYGYYMTEVNPKYKRDLVIEV